MVADKKLTHLNQSGEARMVDIGAKQPTSRKAVAEGWIQMRPATLAMIQDGALTKGDAGNVFAAARLAGIMAAKRTAELVPLCHPIALTHVAVELAAESADDKTAAVHCTATTATTERTGVEMEALVAVQVALLTIYDMCKSAERGMVMRDIRLVHKSGGKSGEWNRGEDE